MAQIKERKYELFVEFTKETPYVLYDQKMQEGEPFIPFSNWSDLSSVAYSLRQTERAIESTQSTIKISELDIKAKIGSRKDSSSNSSFIQIINASEDTISIIANKNNKVLLRAGYSDTEMSNIFIGQIVLTETKRHGNDTITTLVVQESYTLKNSIRVTKSWQPNVSYGTIINDLVDIMVKGKMVKGDIDLTVSPKGNLTRIAPAFKKAWGGFSCEGFVDDILRDLATMFNMNYYTHNGVIHFTPFNKVPTYSVRLEAKDIKSFASATNVTNAQASSASKKVFKIVTFLKGEIDTSMKINIVDGKHKGTYKINEIKHDLDYLGSKWDTELEVEEI